MINNKYSSSSDLLTDFKTQLVIYSVAAMSVNIFNFYVSQILCEKLFLPFKKILLTVLFKRRRDKR